MNKDYNNIIFLNPLKNIIELSEVFLVDLITEKLSARQVSV